jgi:phospholipase C
MPPGLDNLQHIVVLMMENRSFDHMLGSLKAVDALAIGGFCPSGYYGLMHIRCASRTEAAGKTVSDAQLPELLSTSHTPFRLASGWGWRYRHPSTE